MGANDAMSDRFRQIQEIIFGEYADQWNSKFQALEKGIKDLARKTDSRFSELRQVLQASGSELTGEVQKLQAELSSDRQAVSARIETLQSELEAKIEELKQGKIDHDTLGDFLMQWGQQVKG